MEAAILRGWADRARGLLPPGATVYVVHHPRLDHYRLYAISQDYQMTELRPYVEMFCGEASLLSPEIQVATLAGHLWGSDAGLGKADLARYKRWVKGLPDGFPSHHASHVYTLRYL